jgi:hypothetical protein
MAIVLNIEASEYRCEPCSKERGEDVRALVRMIPASVVFMGKLVGSEAYCCALCFKPKFDVKTRRSVMNDKATVSKPPRKRGEKRTAASVTPLHPAKASNV